MSGWFSPMPAARLALLRIGIGAFAVFELVSKYRYFGHIVRHSSLIFDPPSPLFWLTEPLPPALFDVALLFTIMSGILFTTGTLYRVSGPVFAVMLLFIYSYRNAWGMLYHSHNLLVLDVLVLGFCAAADDLSVDRWLRTRRAPEAPAVSSWQYGWPVRLLWLVTALVYFLAGVAKVSRTGWEWAAGESLRSHILKDALYKELFDSGARPIAWIIVDHPEWMWPLAFGSLFLELAAPALAMWRRSQLLWMVAVFSMHWGIFFIMGIKFNFQLYGVAFLPFLPLERIAEHLRRRA